MSFLLKAKSIFVFVHWMFVVSFLHYLFLVEPRYMPFVPCLDLCRAMIVGPFTFVHGMLVILFLCLFYLLFLPTVLL